jgi:hypothetical protein
LSALIADTLGTAEFPNVRADIADVIRYLETLRAFVRAAEADMVTTPTGFAMPDPRTLSVGHMYAIEHYPRLLETIRSLCGQSVLMAPGETDLANVDLAAKMESHLVDGRVSGEDRARLFRLAWDLTCSAFAARQVLFETFNARDLTKNRLEFAQRYDTSRCVEATLRLAGMPLRTLAASEVGRSTPGPGRSAGQPSGTGDHGRPRSVGSQDGTLHRGGAADWSLEAEQFVDAVIAIGPPEGVRTSARRAICAAAEVISQERGATRVAPDDVVRACLRVTPEPFRAKMLLDLRQLGVDPVHFHAATVPESAEA